MGSQSRSIVFTLMACAMLGCTEKREPPPPLDLDRVTHDQPGAVSLDSATTSADASHGTIAAHSQAADMASGEKQEILPKNLWDDVPLYEGAQVVQSLDQGEHGFTAILKTVDQLTAVQATTASDLKARGWKIDRAVDMEGRAMIIASKANHRLHVMIIGGDETRLTLVGTRVD